VEELELEDGRPVQFEIVSVVTHYDDEIDVGELDEYSDEVERVVFWYEPMGGDREYGTVYGPFASEADVIQAIGDIVEEGSP
jgi:hypothetical protein